MSPRKNPAAVALGRLGGRATSDAKATASRANGAKGGRPRVVLTLTQEITREAKRRLARATVCPSCGNPIAERPTTDHAENCFDLRDAVIDYLDRK